MWFGLQSFNNACLSGFLQFLHETFTMFYKKMVAMGT